LSLRFVQGFKFTKLDTPIHKLDPRSKFLLIVGFFATALLFTNIFVLLVVILTQVPVVLMARTVKRWIQSMRGGLLYAGFIFIANLIFGTPLIQSIAFGIRFIGIVSAFSLFFMTTSADDLGLALEKIHAPYAIAFTFTTAVRLVPTMAVDAQTVVDAQRSRGLELDKGNFMKRIRNYVPILIPLIISAIRRSVELAEALEARGFGATEKRTSIATLKMRLTDYAVITLTIIGLGIAVYVYLKVPLPNPVVPIQLPHLF
jgi:energy-coupling factor transport system permease protein